MKNFIILLFLFCTIYSQNFNHFEGTVSYYGSHPLHDWKGVSTSISGEILFEPGDNNYSCVIEIPVESFKSNNGNRDSNMLIYANALEFPKILFKSSNIQIESDSAKITGILKFSGKEKKIITNAAIKIDDGIEVSGDFSINLSEFDIERPSLMFVKIKDSMKIEYNMKAENEK